MSDNRIVIEDKQPGTLQRVWAARPAGRVLNASLRGLKLFCALKAVGLGFVAFDPTLIVVGSVAAAHAADRIEWSASATLVGVERSDSTGSRGVGAADGNLKKPMAIAALEEPPSAASAQVTSSISHSLKINIGDQLKIAVYERMESEEDKWSKASEKAMPPAMSLQMRSEFTGDYGVQENGTVSLPLLGTFLAADRSPEELQGDVMKTYQRMLGRPGIVNVRLVERLPIYVLGPVKNSGLYKFTAGMTAWHAVALAGGFERNERSTRELLSNRLEATREVGNIQRSGDRVASLLARKAVLVAERENRPSAVPADLIEIAGRETAASLIAGEDSARGLAISARQARLAGIRATSEAGKSELDAARKRIGFIELTIKRQDDRLTTLKTLGTEGHVSRPQLLEAEVQLSLAQERREEARIEASHAEQKIIQAEQESAKLKFDAKIEIESQIVSIGRELAEARSERGVGLHIIDEFKNSAVWAGPSESEIETLVQYEIVRRSSGRTVTIEVKGDAELQPGDLVRLTVSSLSRRVE